MIGANIQSRRKTCGLTQEQVAERLGVSRQTVTKWETGESTPDLAHAGALAEVLDVSLDALVAYEAQGTGLPMPPRGKHLFGTVTVGERGQIVIPKQARDLFAIQAGDVLLVLGDEEQGIAILNADEFIGRVSSLVDHATKERGKRDEGGGLEA